MSNNTPTNITVISGGKTFVFKMVAHKATSSGEFYLDPIQFYHACGGKVPKGEHWELEILEPPAEFFAQHKLHVATSRRSANPFVCYPSSLPTIERAHALFKVWCAGSVLTVEHGIDLNKSYKGDDEKFFAELAEKYGIILDECE